MRKRFRDDCLLLSGLLLVSAGCSKKETPASVATSPTPDTVASSAPATAAASPGNTPRNTEPGPAPTPANAIPITGTNTDSVLAQLTHELHRAMIRRKLSGSFEEFVAISHVEVPPPPAGKKYAISKQWRVVLVNN